MEPIQPPPREPGEVRIDWRGDRYEWVRVFFARLPRPDDALLQDLNRIIVAAEDMTALDVGLGAFAADREWDVRLGDTDSLETWVRVVFTPRQE